MTHDQDRDDSQQVHSVTDASEAASIESRKRLNAYFLKMALRVVFFVGGTIIAVTWNKWVGLGLLAISAVLPWLAVMGANLIRDPETVQGANYNVGQEPNRLEAAGHQDADREPGQAGDHDDVSSVTIDGELFDDDDDDTGTKE